MYYLLWQSLTATYHLSLLSSFKSGNGKRRTYKIWGSFFFHLSMCQLELAGNKRRIKSESCLTISSDPTSDTCRMWIVQNNFRSQSVYFPSSFLLLRNKTDRQWKKRLIGTNGTSSKPQSRLLHFSKQAVHIRGQKPKGWQAKKLQRQTCSSRTTILDWEHFVKAIDEKQQIPVS